MSRLWYGEASDTWLGQTPLKSLCPEGARAGYVPTWNPNAIGIAGKATGAFIAQPVPVSPSGGNAVVVPFTYSSGTLVLQATAMGQVLTRAVVVVTAPFNDPSATLVLGTTTDPGLIFEAGDVDASLPLQTDGDAIFSFTTTDFLLLTIEPGASTVGAGSLYYWIQ
jgi:hypothetical protein